MYVLFVFLLVSLLLFRKESLVIATYIVIPVGVLDSNF